MYSKETINRFRNPKFAGELKNANAIGEEGNIKCGDVMKMSLEIENDIIKDIKFQTYGCMAAIASSDVMCELAKGKHIDEAANITAKDIADKLGKLPPVKFHCSILGTHALKRAIEDYKNKSK
ncbi:MAG: iron-sulfur cluster assembly scaffold protein [Nanoarchaeota archaeon]|nr:iron-sulfur cluster assembly scaffold protein [Nanoarchaeota archaeon]MBU1030705.1 iron-sulfur cluster assembly scaffold protein [Nanoarchaeota archaeon]MBU1849560.1 iron-sulfur cluster assembly scaffold protein [Nanoarchaeota archaeon]